MVIDFISENNVIPKIASIFIPQIDNFGLWKRPLNYGINMK